ncbi:MAG: biotin--[acetyl-CoA-carboxylase] ligase [Actinobacteria bacterium]|nr:biotin--[acetyl-CoA-carboxylase] ligase [Cyanobacteriota bacterium]MCL5771986.1 biotin--[acetyl-CoA-carboxylase] ligase [Actinomycetota bacterium]
MENFNKQKFYNYKQTKLIGKKLINFKTINSTNDYASKLENKIIKLNKNIDFYNVLNGTIIISETQTNGHGRNYKKWISPVGGLWFTLILYSNIKVADLEKINLIMAISIYEAIKSEFDIDIKIKWPNDIYYNGKKICGILSELNSFNDAAFLNIGVGLNANNSFKDLFLNNLEVISYASSLKEILNTSINKEKLLCNILKNFEINYENYLLNKDMKNIFLKIKNSILI